MAKKSALKKLPPKPASFVSRLQFPDVLPPLLWWEKIVISLFFFSIFCLYYLTLAPTLPTGDSGELITSAYLLGVPHPPGYPLFNLLGKVFSYFPAGSIGWRINLLSAVCNSCAAIFIYLTLLKITKYWPAAIGAALFFAASPIVWEYSLKAEVFSLNNLFVTIIVYLLAILREYYFEYAKHKIIFSQYSVKASRAIYLIFFISGLGLTNHHTIIFFAPAVMLALYFYSLPKLFNSKLIATSILFFLLGLSFYLYVPLRAHANPYLNWDDAKNLQRFIALVTRDDYGTFHLMSVDKASYSFLQKCGIYFISLFKEFNPVGIILTLLGVYFLVQQTDKKIFTILVLTYLLTSIVFFILANVPKNEPLFIGVFERFFMFPNIFIALFIGFGIYFLFLFFSFYLKKSQKFFIYLIQAGILLSIIAMTLINFPKVDQSKNYLDYNYGRNLLNSVDQNALLLVAGDIISNAMNYLQKVEGLRPDVIVLDQEKLTYSWYCEQMKQYYPTIKIPFYRYDGLKGKIIDLIDANINQHPIYMNKNKEDSLFSTYRLLPIGLIHKVVNKSFFPPSEEYTQQMAQLWKSYQLQGLKKAYVNTSFEQEILREYAIAYFKLGWEYEQRHLYDLALEKYNKAISTKPSFASPYKNAGIIYANYKNNFDQAARYWKNYLNFNPDDPENPVISSFVNKFLRT